MDESTFSLCEAVADLAWNMGTVRDEAYPEDSRAAIQAIIQWAEDFEAMNKGREWDGEYMEEIDAYFVKRFVEQYEKHPFKED